MVQIFILEYSLIDQFINNPVFRVDISAPSVAKVFHQGIIVLIVVSVALLLVTVAGHMYVNKAQQNILFEQDLSLSSANSILEAAEDLSVLSSQVNLVNSYDNTVYIETSIKERLEYLVANIKKAEQQVRLQTESSTIWSLIEKYKQACRSVFSLAMENRALLERFQVSLTEANSLNEQLRFALEDSVLETNMDFYSIASKDPVQGQKIEGQRAIYEERQRLGELVLFWGEMNGYLNALEKVASTADVALLENAYRLAVREFVVVALELRQDEKQQISGFARQLFDASNDKSVFDFRLSLLQGQESFEQQRQALVALSTSLESSAHFYREQVIVDNAESIYSLRRSTVLVLVGVISLMAAALLGYVYFVKKLVYNDLISPILEITELTNRLIEGDLAKQIPAYRSSELAGMAKALDVFRMNALALKQVNADLIKANRDIENFAYAASHDLKSPLRAIVNLVSFLREDLEGQLDDESAEHLDEIMVRAKRLETLLNDLLAYASSGKLNKDVKTLEVQSFIEEIFAMLNERDKFKLVLESEVESISVVATPLAQVLRNLVDNAMKHHDKGVGVIRIEVKEDAKLYHFTVEDDGPGVPGKYHKKVFELFQKLETRGATKGSGMGLSLVNKIVTNFGCNIQIESQPDKQAGTRFLFDWPKSAVG